MPAKSESEKGSTQDVLRDRTTRYSRAMVRARRVRLSRNLRPDRGFESLAGGVVAARTSKEA